jgi:6-phosphogluconolactonase/glucosamine-6-phosphate isomerase/deaminase
MYIFEKYFHSRLQAKELHNVIRMPVTVDVYADKAAVGAAAAAVIVAKSKAAIKARGRFVVAFSGGSPPAIVCADSALLSAENIAAVDWEKWVVFFSDERCVPLTHADSNCRVVQVLLFRSFVCSCTLRTQISRSNATLHTTDAALKAALLDKVPIEPAHVHTLNAALANKPGAAAKAYERKVTQCFAGGSSSGESSSQAAVFDLV